MHMLAHTHTHTQTQTHTRTNAQTHRRATGTLVGVLGAVAPRVTMLRLEIEPCSMNQVQALQKCVHFSSLKSLFLQVCVCMCVYMCVCVGGQ